MSRPARERESLPQRAEDVVDDLVRHVKPHLRGWLHAGTFPVALAAGIVLVVLADGTRATVANAIFAASAVLLFGVSAAYHRGNWTPRAEKRLKRLDHSNIFLIIAGTYTPFSLILLDDHGGGTLLWIVWLAALGGIAFRVFWVGAPRWLYTPVYLGLGWVAVFYLPELFDTGGAAVVTLLAIGGLLYSVGGVVYALKRPNPSPRWFGFHEVFHALTLAAFAAHYIAVSIATYSTTA
ncbi:MAG: hemolysin [Actinomycetota bacterium]|jgi:hemolysin III|nr:hemolysin [Actinomycetota bacterium]